MRSPEITVSPGFEKIPAIMIKTPKIRMHNPTRKETFVNVRVDSTLK
jgi:hypothetical protein